MSDMKPKRAAREPGRSEISPGEAVRSEAVPTATAPAIVPQAPTAAAVVSAQPAAVAEPAPEIVSASAAPPADSVEDPWTAFADAQAVLTRGFEEIVVEVTGMSRSGIAAAAHAAVALIGARTFSEAVEIHAALARRGVDAMIEGSAKLSEIGVKAVSEASRPILSRLGGTWSGMGAGG
jgi:hypothetical protein